MAAPKESLVDMWDPTIRIHLLDFYMTPIRVIGNTLLMQVQHSAVMATAPRWQDHMQWTHGRCPGLPNRNCGRNHIAFDRCRHLGSSAQEQSVRREHIDGTSRPLHICATGVVVAIGSW